MRKRTLIMSLLVSLNIHAAETLESCQKISLRSIHNEQDVYLSIEKDLDPSIEDSKKPLVITLKTKYEYYEFDYYKNDSSADLHTGNEILKRIHWIRRDVDTATITDCSRILIQDAIKRSK